MSSGGSNIESLTPCNDIRSPAKDRDDDDDDVLSLQSWDFINTAMYARAGRLKTIPQFIFDPIMRRRELARAVILHDYPLSIVDHSGFKAHFFNGVFPVISKETMMSDILKVHEFERSLVMGLFEETKGRIAITTDKWISYDQTKRFMAVTGHMIDDDWTIKRRMMRFINIPFQCTSDLLAKITVDSLCEWDVATKVSSIAVENSSDVMLSDILTDKLSNTSYLLGRKLFQTECYASIVSLMVKDAFNVIEDVIEKIRECILFWTATPQRENKFKEASRELGISGGNQKLVVDSVKKWNTTFLMLQTALFSKTVFSHLKREQPQFLCMPTEEEWELVKEIHEKLELFYTSLKEVAEWGGVSNSLALLTISEVKVALCKWVECDNMLVREMALKMQEKFEKYWDTVRDTFAVASVFDPRLKLRCVKFCFKNVYGDGAQSEIEFICQICRDLFNEYDSIFGREDSYSRKRKKPEKTQFEDSTYYEFALYLYKTEENTEKKEPQKPELDAYLECQAYPYGERIIEDYDILKWWKTKTTYPTLRRMARDILAIPICSVAPEHMFDTGDRVLSPHRSRLSSTMVQILMCTQSWLWTDIKGSYSITNFYSWSTSDNYAAVEDAAAEVVDMSSGDTNFESTAPDNDIQSPPQVNASEPSSKDFEVSSLQPSDFINTPMSYRAGRIVTLHQLTFDPIMIRREFAKTVVLHDYPLSIVDHIGFKALFFNGVYPVISQKTLMSDILKVYEFERSRVMGLLDKTRNRIAITTDNWISYDQTKRFIAITGHLIDDDWTIQRHMMRFINVPRQHTNDLLAKITVECLFDWDVATKVSSIAIENYPSDVMLSDVLVDKLSSTSLFLGGKLLQTECFAHTVSLMVKDAFNVIGDVIKLIRHCILFWTATPQREKEFQDASCELGISGGSHKLVLDSVSKWNTTFSMLRRAISYKTVFFHLKKEEPQFLCMPTEQEWELAEEICQKLLLFHSSLEFVSKYHAASTGLMCLTEVKVALSKWILCDNVLVREMASKMLEKFDKYWDAVRDTLAVASVVDPRLKLHGVKICFQEIYGGGAESEVESIRKLCYDLFDEYQSKVNLDETNGDVISSSNMPEWILREIKERTRKEPQKPELDSYLEFECFPFGESIECLDVLNWWKSTTAYPTLKKMAKDILAIPICSVAPEHMFDIGARVLSPHRSRLKSTMVQTLMCTQSWLWTNIKGSYSITNHYSWGTYDDYSVLEDNAAEAAKAVQ